MMKTREQAEARALEFYPNTHIATVNQLHEVSREAYLQCWEDMQVAMDAQQAADEMQQNKQTCGFCVEPKQPQVKEQSKDNRLRKAAARVAAFWRLNPSIVKDWEKDMHNFIEKLEKELK